MLIGLFVWVATHWCCLIVLLFIQKCFHNNLQAPLMAALQGQIKPLWREVGICPDDRPVAQRPPAPVLSSWRLATFMCPLLKGGNVFHLLFKVENTATLTTAEGIQRVPGHLKVSAYDAASSRRAWDESQHKPHTCTETSFICMSTQKSLYHEELTWTWIIT